MHFNVQLGIQTLSGFSAYGIILIDVVHSVILGNIQVMALMIFSGKTNFNLEKYD